MPIFQDLKQFVRSENALNRYEAIEKLVKNSPSWQGNLLIWQIMALIPTDAEKSKLAESLILPNSPSSEWAIISYLLLKETNENVLSSCIMTLAKAKVSSFAFRILQLLEKPSLTNQILYSIYHYIEQTGDERFKDALEKSFNENLPERLLAKGFNAFIKLGFCSIKAKNIAINLLKSETTFNIQSNASFSAIFYLGFSGNSEDLITIQNIKSSSNNSEIIRTIQIITSKIESLKLFNLSAAEQFFYQNIDDELPNFIGYGAFTNTILEQAIKNILSKTTDISVLHKLTKIILLLKNSPLINLIATNPKVGISKAEEKDNQFTLIWSKYRPYTCPYFLSSIRNPSFFNTWHKNPNDLSFTFLNYDTFFSSKDQVSWQETYQNNIDIRIILAQVFSLGYTDPAKQNIKDYSNNEKIVLKNISLFLEKQLADNANLYDNFVDKIYSATIGGQFSPYFMSELYKRIPFSGTSWAFTAIALRAPKLDLHTISAAIQSELETIKNTLINGNMEKDEYILEVTSRFQSILVGANQFRVPITQKTLETLKDISKLIQTILDRTNIAIEEENEPESNDWNSNNLADRPIMRWGAILQVCLNSNLTEEEKQFYEKYIREGLRVAPHVEKRWIVRALVKLDTDDAIKAILYQALQHIDNDFVEHTINELLKSNHPRAHQALIRSISKTNISNTLKIKIINEIPILNPEEILQEFKTLQFMRLSEDVDIALQDAIKRLSSAIPTKQYIEKEKQAKLSSQDIDLIIKSFVPYADQLSIDSKSALRTAEMILIQSKDWGNEAVDLSPIVNMHCKAVELTMRDIFEAYTDAIIRSGELSKKLDILGYGKGNVEKMTLFEEYIANLPIIRTIPYFSKFKLRKMLRAICLYRPGKRFTLDGPKAFALLLLVAGREQCSFHLNKIISLNFSKDEDLFELIKLVHSLQDSRNRAVHEGLTWEARDEIETMRKQAYKIISTCLTIGRNLEAQSSKKGDPLLEYQ